MILELIMNDLARYDMAKLWRKRYILKYHELEMKI